MAEPGPGSLAVMRVPLVGGRPADRVAAPGGGRRARRRRGLAGLRPMSQASAGGTPRQGPVVTDWSPFCGARWRAGTRGGEAESGGYAESPAYDWIWHALSRAGLARPRGFEFVTFGSADQRSAPSASNRRALPTPPKRPNGA